MSSGILHRLRQGGPAIARWLAAVLVLPILLGILPPQQLSAAAAIDRDIALSRCIGTNSLAPADSGDHDRHQDHCILCAACSICGAAQANAAAAFGNVPARQLHAPVPAASRAPLARGFQYGHRPRGPPRLS